MAYVDLDQVRARWQDAPMDDVLLQSMVDAAHAQVVAYAPALPLVVGPDGAVTVNIPANYVEAEVLQVRALGQSQERDGDVIGFGDGYAVRVRPLGADVKALLRPRRGRPVVG